VSKQPGRAEETGRDKDNRDKDTDRDSFRQHNDRDSSSGKGSLLARLFGRSSGLSPKSSLRDKDSETFEPPRAQQQHSLNMASAAASVSSAAHAAHAHAHALSAAAHTTRGSTMSYTDEEEPMRANPLTRLPSHVQHSLEVGIKAIATGSRSPRLPHDHLTHSSENASKIVEKEREWKLRMLGWSRSIMEKYILADSPCCVNVPSHVRSSIEAQMRQCSVLSGDPHKDRALSSLTVPSPHLFASAVQEIFTLLKNDSYKRFCSHVLWRQLQSEVARVGELRLAHTHFEDKFNSEFWYDGASSSAIGAGVDHTMEATSAIA